MDRFVKSVLVSTNCSKIWSLDFLSLFTALFSKIAPRADLNNWSKINNQIFNIGGGKDNSLSLLELTKLVNEISGIYIPISQEKKKRNADIRIFLTDNTKIKNILDWEPNYDSKKIIEDTFNWIINNKNELEGIL